LQSVEVAEDVRYLYLIQMLVIAFARLMDADLGLAPTLGVSLFATGPYPNTAYHAETGQVPKFRTKIGLPMA
jgi:hypothetical protein